MTLQAHRLGAANEYKAAAYFLANSYQVYWPAVQQSEVDFVIETGGVFLRVQVKTASLVKAPPPFTYLQCRTSSATTKTHRPPTETYDLLVVVYGDDLWVIPSDRIDTSNLSLWGDGPKWAKGCRSRWEQYKVVAA